MKASSTLRAYYYLTKPGIIRGNLITAAAGFLFGARGSIIWPAFIGLITGTALVIAAACVANNVLDRRLDAHMQRTKKRALVTGKIIVVQAIAFATALGVCGVTVLALLTSALTVSIGIVAFLAYVVAYGVGKRATVHGTLIGSISGAAPPVAGYVAAGNTLDGAALLLFLALAGWQMSHFFAIAIYRRTEYAAADVPVLPVVAGFQAARRQIILYMLSFLSIIVLFVALKYASLVFGLCMTLVTVWWLRISLQNPDQQHENDWARSVFKRSLLVITLFSLLLALDSLFS